MKTIQEILATKRAARNQNIILVPPAQKEEQKHESFSMSIVLNSEQQMAVDLAMAGKSFCIIGKAGTGKTTSERNIIKAVLQRIQSRHIFRIQGMGSTQEGPGVAVVSYTRVAAGNSRKAIFKDPLLEDQIPHNITTIHNLLEYAPEIYWCEKDQKEKKRFTPKRNINNPITISTLIIEEASMVDLPLWDKVKEAMLYGIQVILIGDINQLPPVFGPSILNYGLIQFPIIELKTIYRQKDDSIVLKNAHNILDGKPLEESPDFKIYRMGDVQHGQMKTSIMIAKTLRAWYSRGEYDPENDIVLSPFNKQDLGTTNMNAHIAQFIGEKRDAKIIHIIAGIRHLYIAEGDDILYQKIRGKIVEIKRNFRYLGKAPKTGLLDRFGNIHGKSIEDHEEETEDTFEMTEDTNPDELTHQASHIVKIELETGEIISLQKTGELSEANFQLAYCLTIHKAQGSEWKRVILILHKDHSIMAFNELLYTAVTRAREQVVIFAKDFMLQKCIETRRIKGSSLKSKIEYFNANLALEDYNVLPF